jgi:hypothetical protein
MFKYNTLYLNECTEEELLDYSEAAKAAGFRTRNSFIFSLLEEFEDLGLESETGSKKIPLSSIPEELVQGIKKPVSRRIRKFLNHKIKEQNQNEKSNAKLSGNSTTN